MPRAGKYSKALRRIEDHAREILKREWEDSPKISLKQESYSLKATINSGASVYVETADDSPHFTTRGVELRGNGHARFISGKWIVESVYPSRPDQFLAGITIAQKYAFRGWLQRALDNHTEKLSSLLP